MKNEKEKKEWVRFSVRMKAELRERLRRIAEREGRSENRNIVFILEKNVK